jgi:phosphoadenosine phosphosulfate reductase
MSPKHAVNSTGKEIKNSNGISTKEQTLKTTSLYWCNRCGVPLLSRQCENCGEMGIKICSDLKPMFGKECEFLEKEAGLHLPGRGWQDRLWMRYKTIWFNGHRITRLSAQGKPVKVKEYLPLDSRSKPEESVSPEILYKANKSTIDQREQEAITFIKDVVELYPKRRPVISFSGGKDSLVVSYIVRKALGIDSILHMFGNTTMEYPDTIEYVTRYREDNKDIPFIENSSFHSFFDMSRLIGPPSRLFAWCCSVFKSAPIAGMVNQIRGEHGIISFEGIRRRESVRRNNRGEIYTNKKIVHQLSAYPILNWKEVEVWLFILAKGLSVNKAYEKGFSRVGCMYCPNNASYNEYLIKSYYEKQYKEWHSFLLKYAKKSGKADPIAYVESGAWKRRVGKSQGKSYAYVKKTPCLKNANAMHFILEREIEDSLADRFKPFGEIEEFDDNVGEGIIVKETGTSEPQFMVKRVKDVDILRRESKIDPSWELGNEFLCVDLLTEKGAYRLLKDIERQIRKQQACVLCGACIGICPTNAISINPHFHIDENKCIHCRRCISTKFLRDSCIALHATQQTRKYRKEKSGIEGSP